MIFGLVWSHHRLETRSQAQNSLKMQPKFAPKRVSMTNQHNRGTAHLPKWRDVALMCMDGLLKPFRRCCYAFFGKILYESQRASSGGPTRFFYISSSCTEKNATRTPRARPSWLGVWFACSLWSAFSGLARSLASLVLILMLAL